MADFEYEIIAIVVILWMIIYPILIFIEWYGWWNKNTPKGETYDCFSLASLAYFKFNYPLFLIVNNLYGPSRFVGDWQVLFISAIMGGEAKGFVDPNNPNVGLCTPATLCHTLVPTQYPEENGGLLPGNFGRNWPTEQNEWKRLFMKAI